MSTERETVKRLRGRQEGRETDVRTERERERREGRQTCKRVKRQR